MAQNQEKTQTLSIPSEEALCLQFPILAAYIRQCFKDGDQESLMDFIAALESDSEVQ